MPFPVASRSLCAAWMAVTVGAFLALDTGNTQGWSLLAVVSAVTPIIGLRVWNQEPALSIAELTRATGVAR